MDEPRALGRIDADKLSQMIIEQRKTQQYWRDKFLEKKRREREQKLSSQLANQITNQPEKQSYNLEIKQKFDQKNITETITEIVEIATSSELENNYNQRKSEPINIDSVVESKDLPLDEMANQQELQKFILITESSIPENNSNILIPAPLLSLNEQDLDEGRQIANIQPDIEIADLEDNYAAAAGGGYVVANSEDESATIEKLLEKQQESISQQSELEESKSNSFNIKPQVPSNAAVTNNHILFKIAPGVYPESAKQNNSSDLPSIEAQKKPKPPIRINRFDPNIGSISQYRGDVKEFNAVGMSIKVQNPSKSIHKRLEEAYNAMKSGHISAARRLYSDILLIEPDNKYALFGLASCYQKDKNYNKARRIYMVLLEKHPNYYEALNNFMAMAINESPKQALAGLNRIDKLNPGFTPIKAQRAMIFWKMGRKESALRMMRKALLAEPDNIVYNYNMAILLDQIGYYNQAVLSYKKLLDAANRGAKLPVAPNLLYDRMIYIMGLESQMASSRNIANSQQK